MPYKALITIDLHHVDDKQRETFYEVLKDDKWTNVSTLTTTWICSFKEGVSYDSAQTYLKNGISKAKLKARVTKVQYAMQLGENEVCIG